MIKILTIFLCIYSSLYKAYAQDWNCSALAIADEKKLPLTINSVGLEKNFQFLNPQNLFKFAASDKKINLMYVNSSKNKINYLSYNVSCELANQLCKGSKATSYKGKKFDLELSPKNTSRSILLFEGNRTVFEISSDKRKIFVKFFDIVAEGLRYFISLECKK